MASLKVIKRMSRRAILMYAKPVTRNNGENWYNECKVMSLGSSSDEGMVKINTQLIFELTNK